MGKVLKFIAIIAVTAAIAFIAPYLAPQFLVSMVGSSMAASITSMALTAVAGFLFEALSPKPTSTAPGWQPSRAQAQERDGFGWKWPPAPTVRSMRPVDAPWWRNPVFMPWERFAVSAVAGNCMHPVVPRGTRWLIVDRHSQIEAGDLVLFRPDDLGAYMRQVGGHRWSRGLVKRFIGIDPNRRAVVYETTNPPNRIETGQARIRHAYRVVSCHPSLCRALVALFGT